MRARITAVEQVGNPHPGRSTPSSSDLTLRAGATTLRRLRRWWRGWHLHGDPLSTLSAEFQLGARACAVRCRRWDAPPGTSPLLRTWRHLAGPDAHLEVMQAGQRPTFVGVAAPDAAWTASFLRHLVCGGSLWARLRRRDYLFLIRKGRVDVHVGVRGRRHPALSDYATAIMLPAVAQTIAGAAEAAEHRAAALRKIPENPFFSAAAAAISPAHAVAVAASGGAHLLITGGIEQREAEALAREAAAGIWCGARQGDALIQLHHDGVRVVTQHGPPDAEAQLGRFATRFCTLVVVSDQHLGVNRRDTFGRRKAADFCALLERVIADRSVLVLNGDFLELIHERYGEIRRSYGRIFELLKQVRRIIYTAGNHDAAVLWEQVKQTRRAVRALAERNRCAEVRRALDGTLTLERHLDRPLRREPQWRRLLNEPRVKATLEDILDHRHGRIFISHGFPTEGVAFHRLGPRDTPEEKPQWYLDDSLPQARDGGTQLLRLLADRRQRLDRVLKSDWDHRVEIVRYHWDAPRGVYLEHGHLALPGCQDRGPGRWVSLAAGLLKRCGLKQVEHWVEDDLGRRFRAFSPIMLLRQHWLFVERQLAVAALLRRQYPASPAPLVVCGHTHEPAQSHHGPVHALLHAALGAAYANCGAWSSRLRMDRNGDYVSDWLEIWSPHQVTVCQAGRLPGPNDPSHATDFLPSPTLESLAAQ